jgi:hypothetical protein
VDSDRAREELLKEANRLLYTSQILLDIGVATGSVEKVE